MPNIDVQVILRNQNNLPRDVYVNTLHYRTGAAQSDEGLMDGIAAAYSDFIGNISSAINGMTIKTYDQGRNLSGPRETKNYTVAGGDVGGPAEVALCLSFYAGTNQPRNRGRIYLGPFSNGVMRTDRPSTSLMNSVLTFADGLSGAGGFDSLWCVYSRTDDAYRDVTNWWVDNAWDTVRSRGAAPTARITGS